MGDSPMFWKEIFVEGRLRFHWVMWLLTFIVAVCIFLPVFFILWRYYNRPFTGIGWGRRIVYRLHRPMNEWVRFSTSIVGCLTLLTVAVRGATCISNERDRQTWDSLLTTPMTASHLLAAKVLGNIVSVRLAWIWLGVMWLIAMVFGGISILALPLLVIAWFVYAAFLSLLGCGFSIIASSSQRAIVYTLLATVGLSVGHWLPWFCCIPIGGPGREVEHLAKFQAGLTPPAVLGILPFFRHDHREVAELVGFSVCGLFIWTCGTLFLWATTLTKLRTDTMRLHEDWHQPTKRSPNQSRRESERMPDSSSTAIKRPSEIISEGVVLLEESWEESPTQPTAPTGTRRRFRRNHSAGRTLGTAARRR